LDEEDDEFLMRSWKSHPLTILGGAILVVLLLFVLRRAPEERVRLNAAPLVQAMTIEAVSHQFIVTSQGSVSPRRESDLIPQVSGEVLWVATALAAGGFFEKGDALARIDDADYRVARERARASVARTESEYRRSKKDLARQRRLADQSVASEARIDEAENEYRIAEASLRESQASLERAERDLTRTELKAPYRGRVRSEQVDLGQFVSRGTAIAKLYAVDFAEVRLPLPDRELAYLDLVGLMQVPDQTGADPVEGARVDLETDFAGARHHWEGTLVRTEAELDPKSRMLHVVARIPDPYGLETQRSAPLAVGLFVEATIKGEIVEGAFVLPRDALRDADQVYVIDDSGRLRFRDVEVLRMEREHVVLRGGLRSGERVCTSRLEAAIDGMAVRLVDEQDEQRAEPSEGLARRNETIPDASQAIQ
jgi:RND family efflux transporter MFP subunit